ncbi:MAG: hypothetical protein ACPGOY_04180 [Rhodospirillaceae bacterium]
MHYELIHDFGLSPKQARAVLNETGAPFHPTQSQEATFPIDVAMTSNGVACFFQYKRCDCVTGSHSSLTEVTQGSFSSLEKPFYRVNFKWTAPNPKKPNCGGDFNQREQLERLENALSHIPSALVRYVVPAFHKSEELDIVQQDGVAARSDGEPLVLCFPASAFSLPAGTNHHVSFDRACTAFRHSKGSEPVQGFSPLEDEIERSSEETKQPVFKTIHSLRKDLDAFASNLGVPDPPEQIDDQNLLRFFGIWPRRKPRASDQDYLRFFADVEETPTEISDLSTGLRKLLKQPLDKSLVALKNYSPMSFVEDWFAADFRCRQIIGQPLGVNIMSLGGGQNGA